MSKLNISDALKLPLEAVTQTFVVYGMKGMGKTVFGAVLAEELARCKQKFSYLDPIGPGYGLRYAPNGKDPGLDLLVLGGKHGDLPIEPTGGAVVADLVVDEKVNTVVDISRRADGKMWSNGEKIRFTADYCTRLYERQGEKCFPMQQIIDEAGRFVPQSIPHGAVDIARCVGAIEQLTELGRNVGVGVCLITQRSARMNKSVSELAECMIAFRTVGPNSVGAITDWLGEHIPKERHKEMVERLRALPKGHALVVSPGWLQFEDVLQIRMRETFDSSATPTADRKLVVHGPQSQPDLEKYRAMIASTVEKAKENDPAELKRQIAVLRKEIALLQKAAPAAAVQEKIKEVPALSKEERELLKDVATAADDLDMSLQEVSDDIKKLMGLQPLLHKLTAEKFSLPGQSAPRATVVAATRPSAAKISTPAPRIHAPPADNGELTNPQVKILQIVNMLRARGLTPNRDMIARWHDKGDRGLHPNTGSYGQNLARLREGGYLNGCEPTAKAHAYNSLPTGLDAARAVLSNPQQAIFDQLCTG